MELYSRVKLCSNKYEDKGVSTGTIGYIIEIYDDLNYEVEFSNRLTGETIAQIVIHEDELEVAEIK